MEDSIEMTLFDWMGDVDELMAELENDFGLRVEIVDTSPLGMDGAITWRVSGDSKSLLEAIEFYDLEID